MTHGCEHPPQALRAPPAPPLRRLDSPQRKVNRGTNQIKAIKRSPQFKHENLATHFARKTAWGPTHRSVDPTPAEPPTPARVRRTGAHGGCGEPRTARAVTGEPTNLNGTRGFQQDTQSLRPHVRRARMEGERGLGAQTSHAEAWSPLESVCGSYTHRGGPQGCPGGEEATRVGPPPWTASPPKQALGRRLAPGTLGLQARPLGAPAGLQAEEGTVCPPARAQRAPPAPPRADAPQAAREEARKLRGSSAHTPTHAHEPPPRAVHGTRGEHTPRRVPSRVALRDGRGRRKRRRPRTREGPGTVLTQASLPSPTA